MKYWNTLKKYMYIDPAIRKKYADSALAFEHKTLRVYMKINMLFFPIYGTILFLVDYERTKIECIVFASTFLYAALTYLCIRYIRKKSNYHHIRVMRLLYSVLSFAYMHLMLLRTTDVSYAIIYMGLLCISITFINPMEYKLLILITLVIPDFISIVQTETLLWEEIYYFLDTLILAVGIMAINQFYSVDRYHLFALESKLKSDRNIDGLTGLFNKRYFEETLDEYSEASGLACAVLVDLDHFKQVNDCLGHSYGDDAIKQAAQILKSAFRNDDSLCRIGGDEFAAFFVADIPLKQMEGIIKEKISSLQRKSPIVMRKEQQSVQITFSIGVCIHKLEGDYTPQEILSKADAAMYKIKNTTRNGACLQYEDGPSVYIYPN